MHMPVRKKLVTKLFKEKELLYVEDFYNYETRKKVVVFVPEEFVNKLRENLADAGAGQIGNYEKCSFKTSGTGTFKPNKGSKPLTGKKNILNYAEEVKLEMECSSEQINKVVTALLKNHPYDEIAYEIYDFKKRHKEPIGSLIILRTKITLAELFIRVSKKKLKDEFSLMQDFKRLALVNSEPDQTVVESAKLINCNCIITPVKNNFKFIII